MIRLLTITLMTGLLGLVLWLPAGYPAEAFYRTVRLDHAACEIALGQVYSNSALSFALSSMQRVPISPATHDPNRVSAAEQRVAARMASIGTRLGDSRYMTALNGMMTLAYYRLAVLRSFLVGSVFLLLPAVLDAAMRRIIRTHQFQQHCPERCAFGVAGMLLACASLVAYVIVPHPLHPTLPGAAIATLIYCFHVVLANYHRSIS